jgi:2-keto-3-deoxy-phosphogluconate aldolase (EC 4.1.2.14)
MTDTAPFFEQTFSGAPLMAILRGAGVERAVRVASTAWELGIESVEVTIQSSSDLDALREVCSLARARGFVVGAGTIVSPQQIPAAVAAGAGYLVSPGFDPEIIDAARAAGIPILPGVTTPTDVQRAVALGLTWLKAFPAEWLGTDWFRHIRGPFPQVSFIATGGMDASNAGDYLAAGVRVVAVGSALEDETQLQRLAALIPAR